MPKNAILTDGNTQYLLTADNSHEAWEAFTTELQLKHPITYNELMKDPEDEHTVRNNVVIHPINFPFVTNIIH